MTPITKVPTIENYDTTIPERVYGAKRNLVKHRLDMPDPADVAQPRPRPYPLPVVPFTLPMRGFSAALSSVGGAVVRRIQQEYR